MRIGRSRRPDWVAGTDWDGLVMVCSGSSWDGAFLSDKHLALQLSRYAPVLFVDPPMSILSPLRKPELRDSLTAPRLSLLGPRLARLTPFAPPGISRRGLREIAEFATRRAMRRAAGTLGGRVQAVVVGSLDNVFGSCGERIDMFYGTDDFASAGKLMSIPDGFLRKREVLQLGKANLITAVSENLAERWRSMGHDVVVVPNGCDAEMYAATDEAAPATDVTLPGPIAGFVGHMSERIDLDYLDAVADTGQSVLLIGPRQLSFNISRLDALLARPNVQWVGPKPFDQLPSYLKLIKVGLTPYADSEFNRSSFPLKTLEYLAAGRAAITTDLPAARWLDSDLITIASTPAEFAAQTVAALQAEPDEALRQRRLAFAQTHSWQARGRDFARLLELPD
jgi:teichuronic acid biosynthesis glycosyltransferase TuaH